MSDEQPRFHYHAHALALQGEFTHPFKEKIEPQASSFVAPFGGFAKGFANPFSLHDVISHKGARSRAEAGYNPNTNKHYAVAGTTLEGLNIDDMVTVDKIVARLTAVHSTKQEEPFISPHGSAISGLRVAGHEIKLVPLIDTYHTLDTMKKVRDHYENDANFRAEFHADACVGEHDRLLDKVRKFFPWRRHQITDKLPEFHGHTIVPLFRIENPKVAGLEVHGANVLYIHNFGRLHIGELFISSDDRRMTMLHVDLGSPQEGNLQCGFVCGGPPPADPP